MAKLAVNRRFWSSRGLTELEGLSKEEGGRSSGCGDYIYFGTSVVSPDPETAEQDGLLHTP